MGTFAIIFILICLIGGLMSRSRGTVILPDNSTSRRQTDHRNFNKALYDDLPLEIRTLIERKQYFELAEVLVRLEKDRNYELVKRLIDAIKFKTPDIYVRVEDIRQDLRSRNNLK